MKALHTIKVGEDSYTVHNEQGLVARKNGDLLADFADGTWEWTNPKVDCHPGVMDDLLEFCIEISQ